MKSKAMHTRRLRRRTVLLLMLFMAVFAFTGCTVPDEERMPEAAALATAVPQAAQSESVMWLDANGGTSLSGGADRIPFTKSPDHLRANTPRGQLLFAREGYQPLCWNTSPDGSGQDIPFGGRTDWMPGTTLYLRWVPLTPESSFRWEVSPEGAVLTGCNAADGFLVIPPALGGLLVTRIAAGAFEGNTTEAVSLPWTVTTVDAGAFSGCAMEALWMFDSVREISDQSFSGCDRLTTLWMGAAEKPRYSVSYFAAFADKVDWLRLNRQEQKLVMAGGSATRYAYSSVRLRQAFPELVPVNMGVYAYGNMLPQYRVMQAFMQEGDVLLSAPEFDTIQTQFCVSDSWDLQFWAMLEADYAIAALLDLQDYEDVFDSFQTYAMVRQNLPELDWADSPRHYDDDGNRIPYDTYNDYGDYTLTRPGAFRDEMLMYFRADYTTASFPAETVEAYNRVCREFQALGIKVIFTYTPRNRSSLTEESTPAARRALHSWLEASLCVPVLLDIEDSLLPGQYFYLIDSHLCDEGVYVYTQRIIKALKAVDVPERNAADDP